MIDPYFSTLDENQDNNAAAVTVAVDTSPRPSASVKPSASRTGGTGGGLTPIDATTSAGPAATPGASGPLPRTGSNITLYAIVGLAAVAAGVFLLVAIRSRRRARFSAE
ncbi:LPXTG cell wall anchor domain-containing protein [Dactylosporangium sp. CS-047395]|uniref:LPXTG cell wall anchor domain-containing protein n=1 Tax=Dactylosporangium sp. CS-047395 TaxID=3239936 RepID=UPI003D8EFBFE